MKPPLHSSPEASAAARPAALKKVLIVSPAFAPNSTPDSQRVRMSLPHYRENGWEPLVLAVRPDDVAGAREDALLATLPADVRVVHCGALPRRLSGALGLGNLGLRAWWSLFFAGARLIRREKIDLVFFSTTQFVTFALGRLWRRLYGVPYVIDLQDPWRTDYYERPGVRRPPGGWKYQFARLQAWLLEEWCFRRASGFISVSAQYLLDLRRRYAWFSAVPARVLHFGASEHDLEVARTLPCPADLKTGAGARTPGMVRFVYTGAAGPVTPHAVSLLFRALRLLQESQPALARRLEFLFVGTSYAPADQAQATILPLAKDHGVEARVQEVPGRVGHLQALRVQAEADHLLLLGSSDLAYSPSKIYPYFLSGRPMLGLVFRNSCLESILRELNCSTLISFSEAEDLGPAAASIAAYLSDAAQGTVSDPLLNRNVGLFQHQYLARTLTAKQTALFGDALREADDAPRV